MDYCGGGGAKGMLAPPLKLSGACPPPPFLPTPMVLGSKLKHNTEDEECYFLTVCDVKIC